MKPSSKILILILVLVISLTVGACGGGDRQTATDNASSPVSAELMEQLEKLENEILEFVPSNKHDGYAIETIKDAIDAAKSGTYGVGAILVHNETGKIMYRGKNKVFSESRSDLHAEMDVLNAFEIENKENSRELIKEYTMFSSLESCPMCLCRIITSGLQDVHHIADDEGGGMVHLYSQLPPVWQDISEGRTFEKADCSDELSAIAEQVFLLTADLDSRISNKPE